MMLFLRLLPLFLLALLLGCAASKKTEDVSPNFELPQDWHHQHDVVPTEEPGWCTHFDDPVLQALVDQVLAANLDLRIARTRVDEARALLRQRRAPRHPQVGLSAQARTSNNRDGINQSYEISAPASYEIDLWGRISSEVAAANIDLEAASLDLEALRLALRAETAETFFELARIRSELRLLDDQIEIAETFLELTDVRQRQGMANAIDIVQQRQQIDRLRETRHRAALDETLIISALATLLGKPREEVLLPTATTLPELPPMNAEVLPADLLERRPDVKAARMRVVAADHRVDAAIKERLPRLQLSASIALQALSVQQLLEFLFFTAAGSLAQPIWEGGRIQGRIDQEHAILKRQALNFSATLLDAIREVETTLARGKALAEILDAQRRQLESAREALDLASEQYRAGILDYLRVLTALQSVQSLELAELASRRNLLSQRVQLCRVTGGNLPDEAGEETSLISDSEFADDPQDEASQ